MSNRNKLISVLLIAAAIIASVYFCYSKLQDKGNVDINYVPAVTDENIENALPEATHSDAEEIVKAIREADEKSAPAYTYYTESQAKADEIAESYAKKQKADTVIKTTSTKEVIKDSGGKVAAAKDGAANTAVIENKYYAVTLKKKHDIKAGAAYVNDKAYGTLTYRNRDIEYTVIAGNGDIGAMVQYKIAEW